MYLQKNSRAGFFRSFLDSTLSMLRDEDKPLGAAYQEPVPSDPLAAGEADECESLSFESQPRFEIALAVHSQVIAGSFVDLRLHFNKIVRLRKKPTMSPSRRIVYKRIRLSDYTPEVASQANLSFTITDCIEFTKRELQTQVMPASAAAATSQAPKKDAKAPLAAFVPPKPEPNPGVPVPPAPVTPAAPVAAQEHVEHDPAKTHSEDAPVPHAPKAAKGKVIFAGDNTIYPKGRKPYQTFSVLVHTQRGDVVFSGVELEKKFGNGEFAMGDVISIEKTTVEFETEMDGVRKVRTKNDFKIAVIKKAR